MDLQENQSVQELLKLLSEHKPEKAQDLSALLFYVDSMERKFDAVFSELQTVKGQLSEMKDVQIPVKKALTDFAQSLENRLEQMRERLDTIKESIVQTATDMVVSVKQMGISALDNTLSFLGVQEGLTSIRDSLNHAMQDTKAQITKIETIGQELRSVGTHLKNVGRAATGKDLQPTRTEEGKLQGAVLAPLRTVHKMSRDGLVEANLTTGTQQRISGRIADASFEKNDPQGKQMGRKQAKPPEHPPTTGKQRGTKYQQKFAEQAPPTVVEQADSPVYEDLFADYENSHEGRVRTTEDAPRLQFDKSETTAGDGADRDSSSGETGKAEGSSKQQKRYDKRFEKAESRVNDTAQKLEKAKEKLPTKRRIKLEKQYDSDSGKIKRHLQFEKEVLPQGYKGNLLKRGGKAVLKGAGVATLMKGHQKLHQVEKQNTAVEAAHKTEFVTERLVGRGGRLLFRSIRNAPYKRVAKLERKTTKASINHAYQKALQDNPQLQKSTFAKWAQKRKIKRGYAKTARDAEKAAHLTQQTVHKTGQVIRAVAQFVAVHKTVIAGVALVGLLLILISTGISSCSVMLSGVSSSIISTMYMSDEEHIDNSELLYTELETELQQNIDDTEQNFTGFDEYRYNIGEISHNPYELMAYLSAVYDIFTFDQVQGEIRRLFSEQYTLSREEIVEVRYRTETSTDPITGETTEEEIPYNWYVLQTTLTVRPLSSVIVNSLPTGDPTDRYGLYMQTYGNRQAFGNPFSFPWIPYISSPYGYRVHPITGAKDLHRGMDIAVAAGTPILSVMDGTAVFAGDAGRAIFTLMAVCPKGA